MHVCKTNIYLIRFCGHSLTCMSAQPIRCEVSHDIIRDIALCLNDKQPDQRRLAYVYSASAYITVEILALIHCNPASIDMLTHCRSVFDQLYSVVGMSVASTLEQFQEAIKLGMIMSRDICFNPLQAHMCR